MVDLSWQRAGAWRTKSGHMAETWWTHTKQTQEADKVWRRGQSGHVADTRRPHGGRKAGTWRTQGGHVADKAWRHGRAHKTGGHKPAERFGGAAKRTQGGQWRTHGRQAPGARPEHIAASLFFFTVNSLGNNINDRKKKTII